VSKPLAIAIVAAAIAAFSVLPRPAAVPAAPAAPSPAPASGDLTKAFAGVSPADRRLVAGVYSALAYAIEHDASRVRTLGTLAEGIGFAIDFAFEGRKPSADGSLGRAIDAHIASEMGFQPGEFLDVVMTPVSRQKAAAALRSVAAAASDF
jgi:hypothetical protein